MNTAEVCALTAKGIQSVVESRGDTITKLYHSPNPVMIMGFTIEPDEPQILMRFARKEHMKHRAPTDWEGAPGVSLKGIEEFEKLKGYIGDMHVRCKTNEEFSNEWDHWFRLAFALGVLNEDCTKAMSHIGMQVPRKVLRRFKYLHLSSGMTGMYHGMRLNYFEVLSGMMSVFQSRDKLCEEIEAFRKRVIAGIEPDYS